jgi:hypothetical protein
MGKQMRAKKVKYIILENLVKRYEQEQFNDLTFIKLVLDCIETRQKKEEDIEY